MKRPPFSAGFRILPEYHLIIDVRVGYVTADVLENYMQVVFSDKDYDNSFDFIVDTREMNFNIIVSEMEGYVQDLSQMEGAFNEKKKIAGIYSSIHQLAYTQFLQREFAKISQPLEFFTEVNEALTWLGSSITEEEVERICKEILKNPQFIVSG